MIAIKTEIDAWISAAPIRESLRLPLRAADNTEVRGLTQQVTEWHRLREETAQLRDERRAARNEVKASMQLLHESLGWAAADSQLSRHRTAEVMSSDPKRKVN